MWHSLWLLPRNARLSHEGWGEDKTPALQITCDGGIEHVVCWGPPSQRDLEGVENHSGEALLGRSSLHPTQPYSHHLSEGSSEKIYIFFRKEADLQEYSYWFVWILFLGKVPTLPKHKGGMLSKTGSAMKPVPQAHVFEDTEAANSHWIQRDQASENPNRKIQARFLLEKHDFFPKFLANILLSSLSV